MEQLLQDIRGDSLEDQDAASASGYLQDGALDDESDHEPPAKKPAAASPASAIMKKPAASDKLIALHTKAASPAPAGALMHKPAAAASTHGLPSGFPADEMDVLRDRLKSRMLDKLFDTLPQAVQAEYTEALLPI